MAGLLAATILALALEWMVGVPPQTAPAQPKGPPVDSAPAPTSSVLDRLRDKNRPIVVFGPQGDDARMTRQRHAWVGPLPEAGINDRDLIVIEAPAEGDGTVGGELLAAAEVAGLRQTFGIAADAFAVILIGRDGTEKARWTDPVSAQEIFGKVDAMPMRAQEVQAKGGGSE